MSQPNPRPGPAPRVRMADFELRPDVFLVPEPARPVVALAPSHPAGLTSSEAS